MERHINHCYQEEDGWCGPACIQMIMEKAGKTTTQESIASITFEPSWGTPYDKIFFYFNDFFAIVGQQTGTTDEEIGSLLNDGYGIIANIMSHDEYGSGGHYVVIEAFDPQTRVYTISDPSNSKRLDGKVGVYELTSEELDKDWYDYANPEHEAHQIPTHRWITFVKLDSLK